MCHKAPRATAYKAIVKLETGAKRVLGRIEPAAVALVSGGFEDATENILKQVNLMGGEVVEIAASGDVGLYAPREVCAVVVEVARRLGKANLDVNDIAYSAAMNELLDLEEVG